MTTNRVSLRRLLQITTSAITCLGVWAGTASANDLFTLEPNPTSDGHLIEDTAGNAYVGWTRKGAGSGVEPAMFCKIPPGGTCSSPISLPIPGALSLSDSASGVIPVFGPGNTVYVVAPRYARNDVVFWTSTDGGVSFDGGTERNFYSSKTNPTDVFVSGSNFLIGAFNSGVGFSTAEIAGPGGGSIDFKDPGGSVAGESMGLDGGGNPVMAFWNLNTPPYTLSYYRYKGAGLITTESNWEGPNAVANGYEPSLAGGPAGLFMVSQDYAGGSQLPNAINVRRFEGAGFGAARTVAVDPSTSLFIGGAIAQSQSGNRLDVAWPGERADGADVMRLFTSTDGGASFAESHVAHLNDAYGIGPNAELATNDSGVGWVTFTDRAGLRIADLNPIAGLPPKEAAKPADYKGKTRIADTKKVGNFDLTLRLPKSCVQSRQRFFAGVGKRKRHGLSKKLGGTIKFSKVVFFFDGRKLRVKKKKPFRYLIDPGTMASGSVHVVKARVTAILTKNGKKKKVKRTLKGTIKAC